MVAALIRAIICFFLGETGLLGDYYNSTWVLGARGDTCDEACGALLPCQSSSLASVNSIVTFNAVFNSLNPLTSCNRDPVASNSLPPYINTDNSKCFYAGGTPSCTPSGSSSRLICCCGFTSCTIRHGKTWQKWTRSNSLKRSHEFVEPRGCKV